MSDDPVAEDVERFRREVRDGVCWLRESVDAPDRQWFVFMLLVFLVFAGAVGVRVVWSDQVASSVPYQCVALDLLEDGGVVQPTDVGRASRVRAEEAFYVLERLRREGVVERRPGGMTYPGYVLAGVEVERCRGVRYRHLFRPGYG